MPCGKCQCLVRGAFSEKAFFPVLDIARKLAIRAKKGSTFKDVWASLTSEAVTVQVIVPLREPLPPFTSALFSQRGGGISAVGFFFNLGGSRVTKYYEFIKCGELDLRTEKKIRRAVFCPPLCFCLHSKTTIWRILMPSKKINLLYFVRPHNVTML